MTRSFYLRLGVSHTDSSLVPSFARCQICNYWCMPRLLSYCPLLRLIKSPLSNVYSFLQIQLSIRVWKLSCRCCKIFKAASLSESLHPPIGQQLLGVFSFLKCLVNYHSCFDFFFLKTMLKKLKIIIENYYAAVVKF